MVKHEITDLGKHKVHRYTDEAAGLSFSLVPARGGCLTDLVIGGVSLLDGYREASELDTLDWGKSAILAPFPNRLKDGKYSFGGREYHFPINEPARNNALHGFVMDKPFEIVEEDGLSVALEYRYDGGFEYFPFPFLLRVAYSLSAAAGFSVFFEMKNTGNGPMPAGLGWHPYFRLGDSADALSLQLPAAKQVLVDKRMIPTGETAMFNDFEEMRQIGAAGFDTGFRLPEPCVVRLREGKRGLAYWQDEAFPFLQVFIPPARRSIALEPMTCNIDALNNGEGLRVLAPGEAIRGRAGLRFIPS
jgi:aldose 1-epimerase